MSNPFEQNPWQSNSQQYTSGPRYGNAYDDEPAYSSTYNTNNNNSTMPGFNTTGYNNAWGSNESNKTEYDPNVYNSPPQTHLNQSPYGTAQSMPPPPSQFPYGGNQSLPSNNNAYRYSGTPYGNQTLHDGGTGYPPNSPTSSNTKPNATLASSAGPEPWNGEIYHPPNKWRFWFRFVILLASIGHLGFAAGARPVSWIYNGIFIFANGIQLIVFW
jgi:hypothetical protein